MTEQTCYCGPKCVQGSGDICIGGIRSTDDGSSETGSDTRCYTSKGICTGSMLVVQEPEGDFGDFGLGGVGPGSGKKDS